MQAAEIFGADISNARDEDAGEILGDALKAFLVGLGDQPRGIKELGYDRSDIERLVEGTLPQRRVCSWEMGDEGCSIPGTGLIVIGCRF